MSDETTQEVQDAEQTPNSDNKEEGKEEAMVPSWRLREDKKKIKEEYEAKLAEKDANAEKLKADYEERFKSLEMESLINKYGQDVMSDEKVQEYREKHPTLSWDEVITLAWKWKTKGSPEAPKFIGRNPIDVLNKDKSELNWSDIVKLPQHERLEIQRKAKAGEVTIKY